MQAVGYSFLVTHYNLELPPLEFDLYWGDSYNDKIINYGQSQRKVLAKTRVIGQTPCDHLATALKFQGIRLHYLAVILPLINEDELTEFIKKSPTSSLSRSLWFVYEWLLNSTLAIDNLSVGSYIKLVDSNTFFTLEKGEKSSRHRVENNLLGDRNFCPLIRKTKTLKKVSSINIMSVALEKLKVMHSVQVEQTHQLKSAHNPHQSSSKQNQSPNLSYLYGQETQSALAIENINNSKNQRFYQALKSAGNADFNKRQLFSVKNQIVDNKNKNSKYSQQYRDHSVYVSTRHGNDGFNHDIQYIAPQAKNLNSLMTGLFSCHEKIMLDNTLAEVIHAAVISFGFLYIRPFADGNARLHRYLIHDVLKQRSSSNEDFIIPISSAILKNKGDYKAALECFSSAIMSTIDFSLLDEEHSFGKKHEYITIHNNIDHLYRYPDLTEQTLFLYDMIGFAINEQPDDKSEKSWEFNAIFEFIDELIDLPNQDIENLVEHIIENKGHIATEQQQQYNEYFVDEHFLEIGVFAQEILMDVDLSNATLFN